VRFDPFCSAGLSYFGFRWYEPNLQRFVNRDPIGEAGGINLYQFGANDPINFIDPFGLDLDTEGMREGLAGVGELMLSGLEAVDNGINSGINYLRTRENPYASFVGRFLTVYQYVCPIGKAAKAKKAVEGC